jgi:pterin-4a-carbinolamine dehydratase
MPTEHLSTALFRETRGTGFFRVLVGRNAPFYIDVLDKLETETSERSEGIAREEAIALIVETLEHHPGFEFDPDAEDFDAASQVADVRERARLILEYLLKCRWLEEPPRRDWRRKIHFDAHGATMILSLRKIAWPDAAVFTDKLIGVCSMLANEIELSERPWQTVETCLSTVREGLNELRSMQKSVQRFTRRQMEEETLQGNLSVVFDDYSEQMSNSCYASLVRARLPLRLPEAVSRISERLADDAGALAEMQTEVLLRHPEMSAETARAKVSQTLDDLSDMLERVLPMADEIDRRTADFTRRSLARFRYLQDVTGERRTEIRDFFGTINRFATGKRLSHLAGTIPNLPDLLLPSVKLPAGLDSLHTPPLRRTPVEQEAFDDSLDENDRQAGLRDMGRALRESVSVQRANAFIKSLPGGKGDRIESADIPMEGEKGFTDLIAVLLHAESADARFRLEVERLTHEDKRPTIDPLEGCSVERFIIIKK